MNITCPSCSADYEVDSSRVPADGLSMRCPKCSHTFDVHTDSLEQDGGAMLGAPSASGSKVERFFVKRPTGKVFGPFDRNALRMMLEAGKLSGTVKLSPDKGRWQGLAAIPEFAKYAEEDTRLSPSPGGTMLGGWASSVVDDDEEDLPGPRPPRLPRAKDSGPSLPKPKRDGPSLPKPKDAGASLPRPKGIGLPKPKSADADLPAAKDSADLPASTNRPELPQAKGSAELPAARGDASLPQPKGEDALPEFAAPLPRSKGDDALPQAADQLPRAKGEDALPQAQDDDLFTASADLDEDDLFAAPLADDDDGDDLFAAPVDDQGEELFGAPDDEDDLFGAPGAPLEEEEDEDDLFGAPDDDEDDLFGAPDDDEDDLFAAPDDDDDDLFGAPDHDEDDLFSAPAADDEDDLFDAPLADDNDDDDLFDASIEDDDPFGAAPTEDEPRGLDDEDSEDLFAAPADDDDLFEDGGLEADALFDADGGDEDDFLSGDSNFSFLDDSPPEGEQKDLAGKSGEWGDDLMGSAPADEAFNTGRFDDGSGDADWNDDFLDDDLDDAGAAPADDDPFRPSSSGPRQPPSSGPRQPSSSGLPAQTTRDEAVEEDKKRGLMTMVGVPLLAVLVLGGAGYGIYANFFAGPTEKVEKTVEKAGPINVDLQLASSDNYGDLQEVIDLARKGDLAAGEEPKLLLVESLFLSRYDDPEVEKHAEKLAGNYADASGGWEALGRGAYEAQSASADAARSYIEALVDEDGDLGYYAHLMMGVGDILALQQHLGVDANDDEQRQANQASAEEPSEDSAEAAQPEDEPAGDDEQAGDAQAENSDKVESATGDQQTFDAAAKQLASRARTALTAAAKARPNSAVAHYWLGRLYELAGDRPKAIEAWSKGLEASPDHIASQVALGAAFYDRGDLNKAAEHLEKFLSQFTGLAATTEQARAHHLIGRVHSARQRSQEAIKSLTRALSLDASRIDTIQALAEQYMAAEKYQEALNFFTTNKNLGKNNPDVMLGTMRAHMGLEDWDEAIKQLEEGEKLFPDDARFPLYLGRLNRERGAFFDAQKALKRAVEIDPELLSAHAALAQLTWRVDEDREAAEAHIQEIRNRPDAIDAGVATEVAKYYQMSERPQVAEQWYTAALDRDPNYWPSRLALARMYLESGEDEKALSLLERAKEEGIQDIRLSAYLADAYRQSGRFAKAVDQINEVIEQFPKNQEYIFIRGRVYFDQGNFDNAREDFNKAYELDPRYHDAYFFVGRTAFEQEDYKKAMKIFRHVLDYKPNEGQFRYWMGRSYEAEGRLTQALEEYRNATSVDEAYGAKNPELFVRRGRMLSRLGYSAQGKRDIARALELEPSMLEALIAMGESNYRDQLYEEAIDNLQKVVAEKAELPDVQYKLGMSLMHTGKELDGAKYLQNAVRYGYEDPEVFQTLGYLYKRMNRNRLAIESFKEFLKRVGNDDNVPAATKREVIGQVKELGGSF